MLTSSDTSSGAAFEKPAKAGHGAIQMPASFSIRASSSLARE